ncbi:MAG: hypothetical protein MNPFHGCM_03017 [Gemmatimonadaceae bacterium]|nr:hypothetical protein [Gemmatimonadaceae bacterium]
MTSVLAIIALGFVLGMRHATDPDHVVAVTTIVARHRSLRAAATIGAVWGIGHTLTLLIVGGGIVLFGWVIPPRVGLSLELSVGAMLVILGVVNLMAFRRQARRDDPAIGSSNPQAGDYLAVATEHSHSYGGRADAEPHGHGPGHLAYSPDRTPIERLDRRLGQFRGYQLVRPLVVGVVHGLAGSAAVALLVLATIPEPAWAVLYLAVFGVGTVAGMGLVTALLGVPFAAGTNRARWHRCLRVASGAISVVFGFVIAYDVGITQGLFTDNPRWTPH